MVIQIINIHPYHVFSICSVSRSQSSVIKLTSFELVCFVFLSEERERSLCTSLLFLHISLCWTLFGTELTRVCLPKLCAWKDSDPWRSSTVKRCNYGTQQMPSVTVPLDLVPAVEKLKAPCTLSYWSENGLLAELVMRKTCYSGSVVYGWCAVFISAYNVFGWGSSKCNYPFYNVTSYEIFLKICSTEERFWLTLDSVYWDLMKCQSCYLQCLMILYVDSNIADGDLCCVSGYGASGWDYRWHHGWWVLSPQAGRGTLRSSAHLLHHGGDVQRWRSSGTHTHTQSEIMWCKLYTCTF